MYDNINAIMTSGVPIELQMRRWLSLTRRCKNKPIFILYMADIRRDTIIAVLRAQIFGSLPNTGWIAGETSDGNAEYNPAFGLRGCSRMQLHI
jgi:hypothetical protein